MYFTYIITISHLRDNTEGKWLTLGHLARRGTIQQLTIECKLPINCVKVGGGVHSHPKRRQDSPFQNFYHQLLLSSNRELTIFLFQLAALSAF